MNDRIIIIGGPRAGKSTLAAQQAKKLKWPHYCTDPRSLVKDPLDNVTYLPEGLEWSEASQYVCDHWFSKPGPWIIEGVGTVRALRKWRAQYNEPCDIIVCMFDTHPKAQRIDGQERMAKAVQTIWQEIVPRWMHLVKLQHWNNINITLYNTRHNTQFKFNIYN